MPDNAPTIEQHFTGKPAAMQAAYYRLLAALEQFGPVRAVPKQTSIHLEKNSGFAGVHPRKDYFNLEFRTDAPIEHARINRQQQLSARRYEHTVKIASEADVDAELMGWLKAAYDLSK
jgi:hypothetical protein